ncbi:MAG: EamA family transporter [Planctomycetaceae bacterium]|jgi:drug/metabolite transporter (DMT)-like permease|nr:EamA family transporter [Planctomycetaceae bacterium]
MSIKSVLSSSTVSSRECWIGTIFSFLSTFCYAASNTTIRFLTDYNLDNDWMLFYKELTGLCLLIPWLMLRFFQGRFRFISKRLIFYVVFGAIFCQLIGAHLQVLGYAVIGLVIAVPLIQSSTLLGVAVLGRYILGDPLSQRRKIAMAILIVAVILLSVGKELTLESDTEIVKSQNTGFFLLIAVGTVVAGIAYSIYIIILRFVIRKYWNDDNSAWLSFQFSQWVGFDFHNHSCDAGTHGAGKCYAPFPVTLMMSIVLGVGIIIFGFCLFLKQGIAGFHNVPMWSWEVIVISGICNMVGFFFQIQGLRMTTAVQASLIAVSQILVLSLIGFTFFKETINLLVLLGLVLTVYGVIMSAKPET